MNYFLFLFIVLTSIGFFNPRGIFPDSIVRLMFALSVVSALAWGVFRGKSLRNVNYPRGLYFAVIGGIFLSVFAGTIFHDQSLIATLVATIFNIFAYLTFFVFLKLDVEREKILNTYIVLSFVSGLVYFINLSRAPNFLFGLPPDSEDLTRGIFRVPVVFLEMLPLLLFYAINKWLDTKGKLWLLYIAYLSLLIFMSVTRQVIFITALLAFLYVFSKIRWFSRVLIAVGAVVVILFVMPKIPIYQTMLELSEEQRDENDDKENIRVQAWRYYTYENQTNSVTPIIGNGVPSMGKTKWGIQFENDTIDSKCYAADVGWAGFFWYYGGIAAFALLLLLLRAIFKKKPRELSYTTYALIFFIITSVASGVVLFYYQIIDITVCLYLIYKKDDLITANGNDSTNHPKLQQRKGYPQLS